MIDSMFKFFPWVLLLIAIIYIGIQYFLNKNSDANRYKKEAEAAKKAIKAENKRHESEVKRLQKQLKETRNEADRIRKRLHKTLDEARDLATGPIDMSGL